MRRLAYKKGDWVIYKMQKTSDHPGPRARNRSAAPKGDFYNYIVDKFWIVHEVMDNGRLEVVTRRGKHRIVESTDPRLRKASWLERIFFAGRFRIVSNVLNQSPVQ
jgi:hypothetical protein